MHIAYLCNEYPPLKHGGIGTFVQLMARQLVGRGHLVSVIGAYPQYSGPVLEDDRGVQVYRIQSPKRAALSALWSQALLARAINELHGRRPIDLLEGTELSFGLLVRPPRCPRVIRMQGGHVFFSHTLGKKSRLSVAVIERLSFARTDYICGVSRFVVDTTRRLLGLGTRQIEVLPNPVDTGKFRPHPEIPEEQGLVCFTGGLREKKGVRQLIQAMPIIVEAVPSAHLWLQGGDTIDPETGGSYRTTLERSTPEVVRDRIRFCGPVSNDSLPQRNAQASVLVYPSWMEAHSLVILEGMASGKAVVSSSTGPGPESIDHGINGLLCDPRDSAAIAEAVVRCLRSAELRKELGSNARRTTIERFAVGPIVQQNERFYERCLG